MKKKWFHLYFDLPELVMFAVVMIFAILMLNTKAFGAEQTYVEPVKIRTTCYCYTGQKGADGTYPKEGLTVAGKKEWLGKACVLYEVSEDGKIGDMIGIYQFRDTGYGMDVPESDKGTIQLGQSIDVFHNTLQGCKDWIKAHGDYLYMQVIDAQG